MVDLFLHFDLSTLYQRTHEYFFPTILFGALLDEPKKAKLAEGLQFFEAMLSKDKKFCTSDEFTVADLSLCITVSQIEAFDFDLYPYQKVRKWLVNCETELEQYGYEVSLGEICKIRTGKNDFLDILSRLLQHLNSFRNEKPLQCQKLLETPTLPLKRYLFDKEPLIYLQFTS